MRDLGQSVSLCVCTVESVITRPLGISGFPMEAEFNKARGAC